MISKPKNPFGLTDEQTKLFVVAELQTRIDGMKNIKDPKEKKDKKKDSGITRRPYRRIF